MLIPSWQIPYFAWYSEYIGLAFPPHFLLLKLVFGACYMHGNHREVTLIGISRYFGFWDAMEVCCFSCSFLQAWWQVCLLQLSVGLRWFFYERMKDTCHHCVEDTLILMKLEAHPTIFRCFSLLLAFLHIFGSAFFLILANLLVIESCCSCLVLHHSFLFLLFFFFWGINYPVVLIFCERLEPSPISILFSDSK